MEITTQWRVRGLVPDTMAHRHNVIINKEEGLCMTILMMKSMRHETKLGRSQLVSKIPAVALPEHVGHCVVISYHSIKIYKTLQN